MARQAQLQMPSHLDQTIMKDSDGSSQTQNTDLGIGMCFWGVVRDFYQRHAALPRKGVCESIGMPSNTP